MRGTPWPRFRALHTHSDESAQLGGAADDHVAEVTWALLTRVHVIRPLTPVGPRVLGFPDPQVVRKLHEVVLELNTLQKNCCTEILKFSYPNVTLKVKSKE